jgi:hypothetical protein
MDVVVDKEIIIEFNKMLLDHSGSLLKVAGGLAIVNLLMIAHIRKVRQPHADVRWASLLIAVSALACGLSFIFGYLTNSAVIASMSDYATKGKWTADSTAEWFTLLQIVGLAFGLIVFLIAIFAYRKVSLEALSHVSVGGG